MAMDVLAALIEQSSNRVPPARKEEMPSTKFYQAE